MKDVSHTYSFEPSDDLVSLVRTSLMHQSSDVRIALSRIDKSDYEGHIEFWAEQMQKCPQWGIAQSYAENCDYDQLKIWIHSYPTNYMV